MTNHSINAFYCSKPKAGESTKLQNPNRAVWASPFSLNSSSPVGGGNFLPAEVNLSEWKQIEVSYLREAGCFSLSQPDCFVVRQKLPSAAFYVSESAVGERTGSWQKWTISLAIGND